MQKIKTLFSKIVGLFIAAVCIIALAFGLTACSARQGEQGPQGEQGLQGVPGTPGKDGNDGADGLTPYIGENGNWWIGNTDTGVKAVGTDCEHEFITVNLTKSTCSVRGMNLKVCVLEGGCGDAYIEYLELDSENHVNIKDESVAATCTETGSTYKYCEDCGAVIEETAEIPALGHDYKDTVVAPTCTVGGYTEHTCERCGDSYKDTETEAKGHDEEHALTLTVVDEEGGNECENGYQVLTVCPDCLGQEEGGILSVYTVPAKGHTATESWLVTKAPTLTEKGEISGYCTACGTNAKIELPALNDTDYTHTTKTAATCTSNGVDEYSITVDGWSGTFEQTTTSLHKYNGKDMPLDKAYTEDEVEVVFGNALADCSKTGYGSFTCDECGEEILVTVKGTHPEFTDEDLIEEQAASCSKEGYKLYRCPICGDEVKVTVEKIAHSYELTKETKNDDGTVTLEFTCKVCGDTMTISGTLIGDPVTVEATCEEEGSITYNYSYTDDDGNTQNGDFTVTTPKLGHSYNGLVFDPYDKTMVYEESQVTSLFGNSPADCQTTGYGKFVCDHCNEEFVVTISGDHKWVQTGTVDATCTEYGKIEYECSVCGKTKSEDNEEAAPLGHNYECRVEAGENGVVLTFTCSRCGDSYTIDATSYDVVTTPATCESEGSVVYNYTYTDKDGNTQNGSVKTETLPKTETHRNSNGDALFVDGSVIYTESDVDSVFGNAVATCREEGYGKFNCQDCGEEFLVKITGNHSYGDAQTTPATCTEKGEIYEVCSVCGDKHHISDIEATGHTFNYTLVKATLTEAGKYVEKCANCDYVKEYVLPALSKENGYTVNVVKAATCSEEGLTTYTIVIELDDGTEYSYTESVVIPATGAHVSDYTLSWSYNGYDYEAYHCKDCDKVIVTSKTASAA